MLALAFAARAAVALSGDFILHPDEIMQYLEQGHRLAFGNGVVHWEFFYGARSWLIPGLIAGALKLFDAAGLGQPVWYVGGIKLTFCAISLAVPAGMYFFARRHFGETEARAALLAGAFWYELVGFAHKPFTEFVATAVVMTLLALCARPQRARPAMVWLAALLAVLASAIRVQYTPLVLALLGLCLLRAGRGGTPEKSPTGAGVHLAVAAAVFFLAVGVFDAATWDAGLFHSYLTNVRFNFALNEVSGSGDDSPVWQYPWWLAHASAGLSVLCVAAALRDLRRYGFLLSLIALIGFLHSVQPHKEYRFIFAVIPLWLLIGAGVVTRLAARKGRPVRFYGVAGAAFVVVSLAGILNALPWQHHVYEGTYTPRDLVIRFIRGQDPVFSAYRYLAEAPGVAAVWQVDRRYISLPGYYYLHRKIPFYDSSVRYGGNLLENLEMVRASVSHLVSGYPNLSVPGYTLEKEFGGIRILRREGNEPPVRRWRDFTPIVSVDLRTRVMRRIDPGAPSPPADLGIRFAEPE